MLFSLSFERKDFRKLRHHLKFGITFSAKSRKDFSTCPYGIPATPEEQMR
jgi:hypothetical protein